MNELSTPGQYKSPYQNADTKEYTPEEDALLQHILAFRKRNGMRCLSATQTLVVVKDFYVPMIQAAKMLAYSVLSPGAVKSEDDIELAREIAEWD